MVKKFSDLFVKKSADECWVWIGSISTAGYGFLNRDYAHRFSYEHAKGPIPKGFHIDHLCRNRRCVNPDHLEAVTPRTNALRGIAPRIVGQREGHCIYDHPHSPEDYFTPSGHRQCRACWRIRSLTKVTCDDCGSVMARANVARHNRRMHGEDVAA